MYTLTHGHTHSVPGGGIEVVEVEVAHFGLVGVEGGREEGEGWGGDGMSERKGP